MGVGRGDGGLVLYGFLDLMVEVGRDRGGRVWVLVFSVDEGRIGVSSQDWV